MLETKFFTEYGKGSQSEIQEIFLDRCFVNGDRWCLGFKKFFSKLFGFKVLDEMPEL